MKKTKGFKNDGVHFALRNSRCPDVNFQFLPSKESLWLGEYFQDGLDPLFGPQHCSYPTPFRDAHFLFLGLNYK